MPTSPSSPIPFWGGSLTRGDLPSSFLHLLAVVGSTLLCWLASRLEVGGSHKVT